MLVFAEVHETPRQLAALRLAAGADLIERRLPVDAAGRRGFRSGAAMARNGA